jgi:hypothetical protein
VAGPWLLVVVSVNGQGPGPGQLGLFGGPGWEPDPPARPVSHIESNNVELMHTVAGNADRAGYLVAGRAERVYARDPDRHGRAVRVPRWEEDAVHQLLRRRWLALGGTYRFVCGAAELTGTTVLVPRETRARVDRWQQLQRPPASLDHGDRRTVTDGSVVDLNQRRRNR